MKELFKSNLFDVNDLTLEEKALLEGKTNRSAVYKLPFSLGNIDTFKNRYEYFKRNEIGTYYYINVEGYDLTIETTDGVLPVPGEEAYHFVYDMLQRRYSYIYEESERETELKQLSFLLDIMKTINPDEFSISSSSKRLSVEDVLKFKILIHDYFNDLERIDHIFVIKHILPILVGCPRNMKSIIYKALRRLDCHYHLRSAIYLMFEEDVIEQIQEATAKELKDNLEHYCTLFELQLNLTTNLLFITVQKGLEHSLIKLVTPSVNPKRILKTSISEGDYVDVIEVQYSIFLVADYLLDDLRDKVVNQITSYFNLKNFKFN